MKRVIRIFCITLLAYVLTGSGHLYSPDEEIVFRTTQALARGEGLAIAPLPDGFATRPANPERADKKEYGQYGVGQSILAIPFYAIGAALAHIGNDEGWKATYYLAYYPPELLGFKATAAELAPRFVCSWFNACVGALLAVGVYLVCLELFNQRRAATWAAILYAFGSLAWPHSRPFFTESAAALMIVLAWWALMRARRGRMICGCFVAGAAAGYAFLVRMDSLFCYPALALVLLGPIVYAARERKLNFATGWIAFAAPALACGLIVLLLNKAHFGSFMATGYQNQPEGIAFKSPLLAGLYGLLCSPGKGLFFFSPALALSFLGWRPLARMFESRLRAWMVAALAVAIIVPLCLHAMWINWAGGWCWGPRHIFIVHPFLAIPIAAWCATVRPAIARVTSTVALMIGMAVQLIGCSEDFIRFYDEYFRVSARNFHQNFRIAYDDYDRAYWSQYYQLEFRPDPSQPWRQVEMFPPAPIQDSIYIPQRSVWAGYPRMWARRELDNFWLARLLRRAR